LRLVTFQFEGKSTVGAVINERKIVPLTQVAPDMLSLVESGNVGLAYAQSIIDEAKQSFPIGDVQLLAPIPTPRRNIMCLGKNYADHIVTSSEIEDPHNLSVTCFVNGEEKQNGNTSQMIFDIPEIISHLSLGMKLLPGDLIATGTPSGVGFARTPPEFLRPGDIVTCTIEGIGSIRNRIATNTTFDKVGPTGYNFLAG